jgi:hypothetical protein
MALTTLTQSPTDASEVTPVRLRAIAGGTSEVETVLALDLGQKTGWAVHPSDGHITSGTEEFRHDRWQGGGIRFLRFKRWLTDLKHCVGALDLVVFEEVRRHVSVDSSHAYGGWLAILTAWCEHHRIPYQAVPVGTVKRHVTGKGNADKAAVIEAVRRLGFNPSDDNEADAIALLLWALKAGMGEQE